MTSLTLDHEASAIYLCAIRTAALSFATTTVPVTLVVLRSMLTLAR